MIFVTVGTTYFDSLIRQIDELKKEGLIEDDVTCQIGSGAYEPEACASFRFQPSIDNWIDEAELVICHGGATVLSLLQANKRFVAIANTELADDHQTKFLSHLAGSVDFPWGRDVKDLDRLIQEAMANPPPEIAMPHLADELRITI